MSQENEYDILPMIEAVAENLIHQLDDMQNVELNCGSTTKRFQYLHQSKSITNILLVLSYCHSLYPRTTTTREVYYYYVTHFRSQRECDQAIADCCTLLGDSGVPRHALGLHASSRGWMYGKLRVYESEQQQQQQSRSEPQLKWDASVESCPITADWLRFPLQLECSARCIVVIEKEGIFQRLVEDQQLPDCILVTGKGFPDMATREAVRHMHETLEQLPVFGLADCDPYGVLVLQTYQNSGIPVQWLGLRPSQIHMLSSATSQPEQQDGGTSPCLPEAVFQELTNGDQSRLEGLLQGTHPFLTMSDNDDDDRRRHELEAMKTTKVELEALHWLGMEFCSEFVAQLIDYALNPNDDDENEDCQRELWMEPL